MGRTEAVEYRGFRVIEIWELKNDLAAGWPFVPFVHMSGLHAAGMQKIDFPQELCLEKCDLALVELLLTEVLLLYCPSRRRLPAVLIALIQALPVEHLVFFHPIQSSKFDPKHAGRKRQEFDRIVLWALSAMRV